MPSFQSTDPVVLTPNEQLRELATILARGVLRLKTNQSRQILADSVPDPLELSTETRLSVHSG